MPFYFGEKIGDKLMSKINLRDISGRAKQWDHPVKGLFRYIEAMKNNGGDILKLNKKVRECYCISILTMALMEDSKVDWWMNLPTNDPPDGLIMTLKREKQGGYMSYIREVEVVEHRNEPEEIFQTLQKKMVEKTYNPNTILVCLVLSPAWYDFKLLATNLLKIESSLKHVFVVFTGITFAGKIPSREEMQSKYTMVQLLPFFEQGTIDSRPFLTDFMDRYNKGQESRIVESNSLYFGTTNKSAQKS